MIEAFTLAVLAAAFSFFTRDTTKPQPAAKPPGLSSQRSQIKPLSPEAIALGKKAYTGPKRPRSAEFYRNRRTKKAVRKLPF